MEKKVKILLAILTLAGLLRFFELGKNPPSLYWDEASLGYNAYSILKTAKDEHGAPLPVTSFTAFGDYKPPGYIYLTVPSIAVFGLNEFAIRFPSAILGTITILVTYFLAKKLFEKDQIALIASFLLAISPWHIQFSRAAFEANAALLFSVLGTLFFVKFAKDSPRYILLSVVSFAAAIYTFTGQRLFVPFIVVILGIIFWRELKNNWKISLTSLVLLTLLLLPIVNFTRTLEGRLRFEEVTIFKNLDPIDESREYIEADDNSPLAKIYHNRRFFFAREYLINYFDAFDPGFLFSHGDGNPRLSIRNIGELYYLELPFLVLGIFFLVNRKSIYRYLIFAWLLISPLGPAVARETPHALRMAHILPTFQLISAFGLATAYSTFKYKRLLSVLICIVVFASAFYYLHDYYFHYPKSYSGEWQYGYKDAVATAREHYDQVDRIVVTEKLGRPYIYFLLYNSINPQEYLKTADIVKDNFFFYDVRSFDKYIFDDEVEKYTESKTMFITAQGKLPVNVSKIKSINDLAGSPVFDIGIR